MIFNGCKKRVGIAFLMLLIFYGFNCLSMSFQVVIGSDAPLNGGALLELKENSDSGVNSTKGMLLPRVALRSPLLMAPILDDDNLGEKDKERHVGLVVYNVHEDYRVLLCKGVHVWSLDRWVRIPKPCCFEIKKVSIVDSNHAFTEGDQATFNAVIDDPVDIQDPDIEYEWCIDNVAISPRSSSSSITFTADLAYNTKYLSVKVYNDCSAVQSEGKILKVVARCTEIQQVAIGNSLNKADFTFAENKTVSFIPSITPTSASSPYSYKWEFGGATVSSQEIYTRQITSAGTLKLTVSNGCSSKLSQVAVKMIQCPSSDKDKVSLYPPIDKNDQSTWNHPEYVFTISELAGYTKKQLADLGITIQWYKKQIKYPTITDTKFYPISGANDPTFIFVVGSNISSTMDIFKLGVKISGPVDVIESIMNCPIKNGTTYYNIIAIVGDQGLIWAIPDIVEENW